MKPEAKINVFNIGMDSKGRPVVRALVDGRRVDIPTDFVTFAKLAEMGVTVKN